MARLSECFSVSVWAALLASCSLSAVSTAAQRNPQLGKLKLNQLQVIGTHNSYKLAMDSMLMAELGEVDSGEALSLDYAHRALGEQLDLGVRALELDVLYDPEGGRYSDPRGLEMERMAGLDPPPIDTASMAKPGFKVMHIQDLDFRATCPTFELCLGELAAWSAANPRHLPIMVSINAKEGGIPRPGFTEALPFDTAAFDALDAELRERIPAERLLTPDGVRGDSTTLAGAVRAGNWPSLEASLGKFLFVLDGGAPQTDTYLQGHPSLRDRAMFIIGDPEAPDQPEDAVFFVNEPQGKEELISRLVGEGFLVRTRADAGTTEARAGDYSRLESAMRSGAHFVSTDYEFADPRFGTEYEVRFPDDRLVRCNPVTAAGQCTAPLKASY